MNKLYEDKRQFVIHSRHKSQRQTPPCMNNLIKRQESANRVSRAKLHDDYFCNMHSTGFFPKRDSVTLLMNTKTNWDRPKLREAWK